MHPLRLLRIVVAVAFVAGGFVALQGGPLGNTLAAVPPPAPKAPVQGAPPAVPPAPPAPEASSAAPEIELYARVGFDFRKLTPLPPHRLDAETLWLARCIYSETKRPHEQELVAWVVRNRVETGYRGKRTYRDVVLDPLQFSAFNPGTRTRSFYSGLTYASASPGWQRALRIAHDVRYADDTLRPFPETTRHFYSERSMVGTAHPEWALGADPVHPERPYAIDARRFRFFAGVA